MAVIKVLPKEEAMVAIAQCCPSSTSSAFARLSITERRRKFSSSPTSVVEQPPTKRVRFSTTNTIEVSHELSKEERKQADTWYAKSDFKCFVQHAASFALAQMKSGNSSKSLESTFVSCFFQQPSSTDVTTAAIEYACQQAVIDKDNCGSSEGGDTSRGIETLSSPSLIGGVAKNRRKNTIRSVVKAYKKNASRRRRQGGQVPSNTDEDDDTLLRQISEYHSRPAKHFALAMGFVDALSVFADKGK